MSVGHERRGIGQGGQSRIFCQIGLFCAKSGGEKVTGLLADEAGENLGQSLEGYLKEFGLWPLTMEIVERS